MTLKAKPVLALLMLLLFDFTTEKGTLASSVHTSVRMVRRHVRREQLTVVTVATNATGPQVTQLLDSCRSRYNITVLGKGMEFRGMLTKLTLVMQHLRTLSPEQLVLFLDQDVRCFPCKRDPVQLFNEDQVAKIIFATDPDCYPETWKSHLYPPSPSSAPKAYQFLNSGTYIGRAGDILHVLAQHLLHHMVLTDNPKFSDQGMFGNLFLAQYYGMQSEHDPIIQLDYAGEYFQVFDTRQTKCWKQDLATKQVMCREMFTEEACILHTAGHKAFFYEQLVPRWLANETFLY